MGSWTGFAGFCFVCDENIFADSPVGFLARLELNSVDRITLQLENDTLLG